MRFHNARDERVLLSLLDKLVNATTATAKVTTYDKVHLNDEAQQGGAKKKKKRTALHDKQTPDRTIR